MLIEVAFRSQAMLQLLPCPISLLMVVLSRSLQSTALALHCMAAVGICHKQAQRESALPMCLSLWTHWQQLQTSTPITLEAAAGW